MRIQTFAALFRPVRTLINSNVLPLAGSRLLPVRTFFRARHLTAAVSSPRDPPRDKQTFGRSPFFHRGCSHGPRLRRARRTEPQTLRLLVLTLTRSYIS